MLETQEKIGSAMEQINGLEARLIHERQIKQFRQEFEAITANVNKYQSEKELEKLI